MADYRTEVTGILGEHCIRTLKEAASSNRIDEETCLELARQISPRVYGHVQRDIDSKRYSPRTIAVLLDKWYETQPDEVQRSKIVTIFKSPDINNVAIAREIEQGGSKGK